MISSKLLTNGSNEQMKSDINQIQCPTDMFTYHEWFFFIRESCGIFFTLVYITHQNFSALKIGLAFFGSVKTWLLVLVHTSLSLFNPSPPPPPDCTCNVEITDN